MSVVTEIVLATTGVLILLGAFLSRLPGPQFHQVRAKIDAAEAKRFEFIRHLTMPLSRMKGTTTAPSMRTGNR